MVEWYDATYTVLELIVTGEAKMTCCQPEADSLVNVAEASKVPPLDHRLPMCVPVLALDL